MRIAPEFLPQKNILGEVITCPRCFYFASHTHEMTCCWCNAGRLVPVESTRNQVPVWERGDCHCDTCNNLRNERTKAGLPTPDDPITPEYRTNRYGAFQMLNSKGWWTTIKTRSAA